MQRLKSCLRRTRIRSKGREPGEPRQQTLYLKSGCQIRYSQGVGGAPAGGGEGVARQRDPCWPSQVGVAAHQVLIAEGWLLYSATLEFTLPIL